MIPKETMQQIQHAPIAERIQMIEVILQSLKHDIGINARAEKPSLKPFKVRAFNLGQDIEIDRDENYADRSF